MADLSSKRAQLHHLSQETPTVHPETAEGTAESAAIETPTAYSRLEDTPPVYDRDAEQNTAEDMQTAPQEQEIQGETDEGTAEERELESETREEVQVEPVPAETRRNDGGPGLLPGLLIGAVVGCAVGVVLHRLIAGRRKSPARQLQQPVKLEVATLQGLGARENQQDAFVTTDPALYAQQGVLLCVADGMGGLQNGELVSKAAASAVSNKFSQLDKTDPERLLAALVQSAAASVNMVLSPDYGSGGTTLLIGLAMEGRFYYAAVGDSRICLYRNGELIHLNRPHIFEDELLLRYINGEMTYDSARNYNKKGALTSYLGMGKLKYVDIPDYHIPMRSGDRFILMSDGVFNTLSDIEIGQALDRPVHSITSTLNKEIERKQKRFQDNYSAVILAVD